MIIDGITYITVKEAAILLDVSESRVRQFLMEGRLSKFPLGKRFNVIPLSEVQALAKEDRPPHIHRKNE